MCEGHARCTKYPVYKVSLHRIDMCNRPPGATSTFSLCPACTRAMAYRIEEGIIGEGLHCQTCRRWIAELHHVFAVEFEARSA